MVAADDPRQNQASRGWVLPFFSIWIGQAFSLVGSSIGGFALVWWLTQKSGGSATVLAMASLVSTLPHIFLGPFIGAMVDRLNRKRVMIIADTVIAFFSAVLLVLSWTENLAIWHIYILMVVRALGGIFHWVAMQTSTSLMVPKEQLARVAGMNQTLHGFLGIITPPLGALLLGLMPLHGIMAIDVITAAFAVGPLLFVRVPQPARREAPASAQGPVRALLRDVAAGFVYLWHWPGMFIILIVATVLNAVVNPGFSLLPIYVTKHFNGGVLQLGWMDSAWGAGLILGGVILSVWGGFRRRILTSIMGLVIMSAGTLVMGLVPGTAFYVALAALVVCGLSNPIVNGPFQAVIQEVVDPDMQGRVFTVIQSIAGAASPLGMLAAGPVADRFGVQTWFLLGGVVTLLMAIALRLTPAVMNLEETHRRKVESTEPRDAV